MLFALELRISEERQLLEARGESLAKADRSKANFKEMSTEMSAFMKGIDEADKGRLEKRLDSFHQCSEPFLEYFRKTKRVVRLDLKVPNNEGLNYHYFFVFGIMKMNRIDAHRPTSFCRLWLRSQQ